MLSKSIRLATGVIVFLLALPIALGSVGIELGDALYNTDIIRASDFKAGSGDYSACVTDQVTVPLRITNTNSFAELYTLRVDDSSVLLSSKQAALQVGQSGIITLTLSANGFSAVNTSLIMTVGSRREAVERSFEILVAYEDCFAYVVELVADSDYCACEFVQIAGEVVNEGARADSYLVAFSNDAWLSSSLGVDTLELAPGAAAPFVLEGSVPCSGDASVSVAVDVTSGGSGIEQVVSNEYSILDFSSCYDTRIAAMDVLVDYSGREVPIKITNKGLRAATYSLSLEGVPWYVASLDTFTLAEGQSRIISLYLRPDASVEEGEYVATLLLQSDVFDAERDIVITVKEASRVGEVVGFYASFLRYYWILVILVVLIAWGAMEWVKRRKVVDAKVVRKWKVAVVAYFIFAVLVLLGFMGVVASYFVNRSGAETILPTPTSFAVNMLVGALVIVVLIPLVARFMKKGVTVEKKVVEKVVEKKVVEKKVVKKEAKKVARKKFGDWMIVVSVLVIVAIAVALFELLRAKTFPVLNEFFLLYYPYMLAGFVILVVLIAVLVSLEKRKKKKK